MSAKSIKSFNHTFIELKYALKALYDNFGLLLIILL